MSFEHLRRVKALASESNGVFSEAQLRWWIHRAAENGLEDAGAIKRIGRAVYIDIPAFQRWIDSQKAAA